MEKLTKIIDFKNIRGALCILRFHILCGHPISFYNLKFIINSHLAAVAMEEFLLESLVLCTPLYTYELGIYAHTNMRCFKKTMAHFYCSTVEFFKYLTNSFYLNIHLTRCYGYLVIE